MIRSLTISSLVLCGIAGYTHGAIVSSQVDADPALTGFADDGVISANEYAASYANGGGSGFGGTLGGATVHMDSDGTNLYIGFEPGGDLNDIAALFLDTRAGGFTDADMNDGADGSRRALSQTTADADDLYPSSVLPDFGVTFGDFGTVVFELTGHAGDEATATDGHLNFVAFEGDQTGNTASLAREIAIPLATLGNPGSLTFFAAYTSDSGFSSNESLPASAVLNGGGNPGFDNGGNPVVFSNSNEFIIPEPASLGLMLLGGTLMMSRRRRG